MIDAKTTESINKSTLILARKTTITAWKLNQSHAEEINR